MSIELIDTHCHLDAETFNEDRETCVERAVTAGVTRMITIGTGGGLSGAHRAIALAERYPMVWATVGVHPHNAGEDFDAASLEQLALHPKVVAIGETGLDFFRDWAPKEQQRKALITQIQVAIRINKPLIIHCREAGEEALTILTEHGASKVGGVFHCFSENALFAKRLRELGFSVSFPGQITFKKADFVREVCKEVPLEQILIETDSPFLAPEPHRGKRCEPSFVVETAQKIASIKGLSLDEVAAITTSNALKLFTSIR